MDHIDHPPVTMRDPAGRVVCLACGAILSWVHWQLPAQR